MPAQHVYFVQDNCYNHVYVPRYQERHRNRRDEHGNDHRGGSITMIETKDVVATEGKA